MNITITITSLIFLLFFAATLVIYYALPLRFRWIGLFVFSLVFLHLSAKDYTIIYSIVSVLVTTFYTRGITKGGGKRQ